MNATAPTAEPVLPGESGRASPTVLGRLGRLLGPGLIWAMAAIGQTHVILSTYAGARYGYALLWLVVLSHLLAYPVFEYGARYAVATGDTLMGAYMRMRRARRVVLPVFGLLLLTVPFLILASLLSVTASILLAAFPQLSFNAWCVVTMVATAALVFAGHYRGLEAACIGMSGVLLVGTLIAFCIRLPEPRPLLAGVVPAVPAGSLITLVALMRLPSDPASSIMLSSWAVRKRDVWLREGSGPAALRRSLLDFRLGYGLSLIVAVIFLALGGAVLHPRGVDLEGVDVALHLSRIYTDTVGAWTFPLFILIAFVALWGGYYSVADGVPRMFEDLAYAVVKKAPPVRRSLLRTGYTLLIMVGGLALATVVKRPVFLVLLAVSTGLLAYPLIYGINIYAVTRLVDPEYRPSRFNLAVAVCGLLFGFTGAILLVLTRVAGLGA